MIEWTDIVLFLLMFIHVYLVLSVSTDVYSCLFGAVTSSKEEEMSSKTTLVSVFSDRTWKLRLCFISEVTKLVNVWLRFVHTSTQISRGRFLGSKNWYWFIKMRIGFQSEQCNVEESDESLHGVSRRTRPADPQGFWWSHMWFRSDCLQQHQRIVFSHVSVWNLLVYEIWRSRQGK